MAFYTHIRRMFTLLAVPLALSAMANPAFALLAPTDIVDLKVLVLSADGTEPSFSAWTAALSREGVPFDTLIAAEAPAITADTLMIGTNRAKYQAVVLATGGLYQCGVNGCESALAAEEWTALNTFETRFGVRRVTAYAYPTPEYGLNYPFQSADLAGTDGQATAAGKAAFPYLTGTLPLDVGAWGYYAEPIAPVDGTPSTFTTLIAGPAGPTGAAASLVGVYARPDGFEELVVTVATNQWQLHSLLWSHGLITWATKGVHLGYQRNYLTMHIDDVFLPDDRWDMNDNVTYEDDGTKNPVIRMTAADVDRAKAWQKATGLQMDLVFNGGGSVEWIAEKGSDPLTTKLKADRSQFSWINHTYLHPNLDLLTTAEITSQITQNVNWAKKMGISIDKTELVTGEHSGLANPAMPAALTKTGIKFVAADNSRQPTPYVLGSATTIPRYPANVYYNVGTFAEQLDEYNWIYFDNCVNTATTTCLTAPATWEQYVNSEATIMLRHLLLNDPRPHYFHQSNLAEDGTFYPVIDEVLARFKAYLTVGLEQPYFSDSSVILSRQAKWASAPLNAYYKNGLVYVTNPGSATDVPVTGVTTGGVYGGEKSLWSRVSGFSTKKFTAAVAL